MCPSHLLTPEAPACCAPIPMPHPRSPRRLSSRSRLPTRALSRSFSRIARNQRPSQSRSLGVTKRASRAQPARKPAAASARGLTASQRCSSCSTLTVGLGPGVYVTYWPTAARRWCSSQSSSSNSRQRGHCAASSSATPGIIEQKFYSGVSSNTASSAAVSGSSPVEAGRAASYFALTGACMARASCLSVTCRARTGMSLPAMCSTARPFATRFFGQSRVIPGPERTYSFPSIDVIQVMRRDGFPVLRPKVVSSTSFSRAAASRIADSNTRCDSRNHP